MINHNLADRDFAENLWLWRRRQPSPHGMVRGRREGTMSQVEAAEMLDLSHQQYINLERGDSTLLKADDLARLYHYHSQCWEGITPNEVELCFLARRRSGLTIKQVAALLGMSVNTFAKFEELGAYRIREFWQKRGFYFPAPPPLELPADEAAA